MIGGMLVFGKPTAATEIPWRWAIAARFSKKEPKTDPFLVDEETQSGPRN